MNHHFIVTHTSSFDIMQFIRRFSVIQSSFRFLSSTITNVTPSTTQKELYEVNKLMKTYNNTHVPIRTLALLEWMLNITHLQPDFICYFQIIRACGELNHLNTCQKIHRFIENDQTLPANEYRQLQIKLIYMYAKMKRIDLAEQIFQQAKAMKKLPLDTSLFGNESEFTPEKYVFNESKNKIRNYIFLVIYNIKRKRDLRMKSVLKTVYQTNT